MKNCHFLVYLQKDYEIILMCVCVCVCVFDIVMEIVAHGSLRKVLDDEPDAVTWPRRWQWACDVAQGMAYLHGHSLLHRDLKSPNVLISARFVYAFSLPFFLCVCTLPKLLFLCVGRK